MAEPYSPRYKWRETWPGESHQDYVALDGELSFGRIQLDKTSHMKIGLWKWNITHIPWVKKHLTPHSGWAPDAREAARHVEELYQQLRELHEL